MEDWGKCRELFQIASRETSVETSIPGPPRFVQLDTPFFGGSGLFSFLEVASSELFSTNQCRSRKVKSDVRAWPRISTQAAKVRVSGNNHMLQTMFPHARGL